MECACTTDDKGQITHPCTTHAEYAKLVARGFHIRSQENQPYAAAAITFIDRNEITEKRAMVYPIARIELFNIFNDRPPETARTYIVNDGKWLEQQ